MVRVALGRNLIISSRKQMVFVIIAAIDFLSAVTADLEVMHVVVTQNGSFNHLEGTI